MAPAFSRTQCLAPAHEKMGATSHSKGGKETCLLSRQEANFVIPAPGLQKHKGEFNLQQKG